MSKVVRVRYEGKPGSEKVWRTVFTRVESVRGERLAPFLKEFID